MGRKETVITRPSVAFIVGVFLLQWTLTLSWRFFTGNFMDGEERNDATFFRDASRMYRNRRKSYSWWKKKARYKRILWRHAFFWPTVGIVYGCFAIGYQNMILIGVWLLPFAGWYLYYKLRPVFFVERAFHHDGRTEYYWALKPKYQKIRDALRYERPTKEPTTAPIPSEYAAAVHNEIESEGGEAPMLTLKLLLAPDDDEGGDA